MLGAFIHLWFVVSASAIASAGGWVFGRGTWRKGLFFGAIGVALFLLDDFIFGQ